MNAFHGSNILITGGTRGIGFAIASRLAAEAACIFIVARDKTELDNTAAELVRLGASSVAALQVDLAEGQKASSSIAKWVAKTTTTLDLVVLNAGFYIEGTLAEISEQEMRRNLEVNFLVNHFIVQDLLTFLRNSNRARILLIGSTAAYEAYPIVPTYGVAKWALRGLAINLRKELAPLNIAVTFISPGATWTTMWEGEQLPRSRLLEPTDIAELVWSLGLLSPQAVVEEIVIRPMLGDMHD